MRDVVFGAATGYSAVQVAPFLRSLRATGFAGEVVLFVLPTLSSADRAAMRALGATLVFVQRVLGRLSKADAERRFTPRLAPLHRRVGPLLARLPGSLGTALREMYSGLFHHPASSRFADILRHLRQRPGRYRQVLLTDVRDVVFQADPFADPLPAAVVAALETDKVRTATEPSNAAWARRFYGEHVLTQLADRRVSCVGTVFGTAAGITHYLEELVREMVGMGDRGVGQFGPDTSAHNLLLWSGRLPDVGTAENGSRLVFTVAGEDVERFRIENGVLLSTDGRPVAVVHMYDRHPALRRLAAVARAA